MKRFCILCVQPIDLKRIMRGACTCSKECYRKHKNEIRACRAESRCRLCGYQKRARKVIRPCAVGAQDVLTESGVIQTVCESVNSTV